VSYFTLARNNAAGCIRAQAEFIGYFCDASDMVAPSNDDDLQAPRCKKVAVW